eukprot:scaffold102165_cov51-Phaeocystis_antarctica.AAC.2
MPPAEMIRSLGRLLHTTSFGPLVRDRDSGAGTRAASATEEAPTAEEAHAATSIVPEMQHQAAAFFGSCSRGERKGVRAGHKNT